MPGIKEHIEALIFDIQRFSLHDGPGVRTTVFFKGCNLRCLWCQNPESRAMSPEMAFYHEQCLGCFRCEAACPAGAITRDAHKRIDHSRCDSCGLCAEACPADALRRIGRKWSAPALAEELVRDADFFKESGGGVTLSGGEPMLHAAFAAELCRILKNRGIHITLETAGNVDPGLFDQLSGMIDLVYFDIKHGDGDEHRRLTGSGNELVLRCLGHLVRNNFQVQPRMPVIPGANDDETAVRAIAWLIKNAGLSSVHCLPYHNLGNSKLGRLDTPQAPYDAVPPDGDKMETVRKLFEKEGIDAVVYG